MNRPVVIILILLFSIIPFSARATSLSDVQARYSGLADFSVNFAQLSYYRLLGKEVRFTGKLYYKRPGYVRMDVYKPERQIIVMKGTKAMIYLPGEKKMIVQDVPKDIATQNILAFFSGLGSIEDAYIVDEKGPRIYLSPKNGRGSIEVLVNGDLVKEIDVIDAMGNHTHIVLSGYRFNLGLKEDLFNIGH